MPIYEYRRQTDGKIIEIRQSIHDEPLTQCPETGDPVQKIVSRTSFQLKGSGWYTTDYKPKPGGAASGAADSKAVDSKTEAVPTAAAGESKKEAPAPKPEKKESPSS